MSGPRAAPATVLGGWVREHIPEFLAIAVGVALRWSMRTNFDPQWSYDVRDHLVYIHWLRAHGTLPPLEATREAYHPPLYYLLAALALRLGVSEPHLGTISIVFGVARLGVLWAVFARWLPESKLARRVALVIAAVQPTSIHLDGMVTGEALSNLEAAAVMWIAPSLYLPRTAGAEHGTRAALWTRAVLLGALAGLSLLTKVSGLAMIAALGLGLIVQAVWRVRDARRARRPDRGPGPEPAPGGWRGLARILGPWVLAAAVCAAVCGPYFARNHRLYGKVFLSGFDGPDRTAMIPYVHVPLLQHRPAGYFLCWTNDIYGWPFYPSGVRPRSCFWPQLVASTWVDFYRYHFANGPPGTMRNSVAIFARASAVGGTALSIAAVLALGALARWLWRRRDAGRLALLFVPVIAVVGQLYFATAFPIDGQGMVKGLYMQFASPPLYAGAGVAVAWLWEARAPGRILACALSCALLLVGSYSLFCRFFT